MEKRKLEVAIIGAGMSGLLMGIRLQRAGIRDFTIYEKAERVGGTWRENTYPGLACDVPSFLYSYSFEPKLDWSHRFAPGAEIQSYFEGVAERYGLLDRIRFGHEIEEARFEPASARWHLRARNGAESSADVLILASGPLHEKHYPDIEGLDRFEGAYFHSAAWDHAVPLEGQRIGVIGTGSSAVQMMEPLSEVAGRLTMFQRTAQWIMPTDNVAYSEEQRARVRRFPLLARLTRAAYKLLFDTISVAVVQEGWGRRLLTKRCQDYLATVSDPELRRKLTPAYAPGCKRLVMSNTFYPTLEKPHVDLVVEGIERVEERGVRTKDGVLHELDVLVLATGFDAHAWGVRGVVGAHGKSLQQAWAEGTRSYRSVAMPGFPNFFMLVGPHSPIGNLSVIDVSETQSAYVVQMLEGLRAGRGKAVEPRADATRAFHDELAKAMSDTVWVTGCNSWYLDEQGVPITWPWSARRFRREMRRPRLEDWAFTGA